MLTARQNYIECITEGGKPDRASNQFETLRMAFNPSMIHSAMPEKGGPDVKNSWGVTYSYPENVPASFPVHTPDKVVIKDIEEWQKYVKAPSLDFPGEEWDMFRAQYDEMDREKVLATTFVAPGIFEQCHHLGEISETLVNLAAYPDEMHDLIKYIKDYELKLAELICDKLKPDALFHHDDWGGQKTTFMSPAMFEDFFVEPYKEVYGYYHDHGVKYVIHHSDSYGATLIPSMIEMGIDVWQGCFSTNNLPEMIKKYGGKISFMGGIENCLVDYEGWTRERIHDVVYKTIDECGIKYFIPCIAQGGSGSVFPGVYKVMGEEIDRYNREHFGCTQEEIEAARVEEIIMF
ncbi:MAG: uroporphyrinogen decarboxylase [Lachnospiraceae bacterium]|nr:uroporphyrinogen decarboxylase [Lachnospiraceae bacterium]